MRFQLLINKSEEKNTVVELLFSMCEQGEKNLSKKIPAERCCSVLGQKKFYMLLFFALILHNCKREKKETEKNRTKLKTIFESFSSRKSYT